MLFPHSSAKATMIEEDENITPPNFPILETYPTKTFKTRLLQQQVNYKSYII